MQEYSIYVGLNDQATRRQMFETEKYVKILKYICKAYRAAFSFNVIEGGYVYENGDLENETSLHISLLNQTEENVNAIAGDLCTFFNQESVLIVTSEVNWYYVNGEKEVMHFLASKTEDSPDENKA